MTNKITTSIVAFGMSARTFHAPLLHQHDGYALYSVVERHRSAAREQYTYIKTEREYEAMLQNDEVELVVITTPNALHAGQIRQALEAGKHVVVEKPFVVDYREGSELVALAKEKGCVLTIFQNRRWDGDFLTISKMINDGAFGRVYEIESRFDRFRDYLKGWKEQEGDGAGITYDLGAHLLDQAFHLLGDEGKLLFADLRQQRKVSEVTDYMEVQLDFAATKFIAKASMTSCHSPRWVIRGEKGTLVKEGMDPQEMVLKAKGAEWQKEDVPQEYASFYSPDGKKTEIPLLKGAYSVFYDQIYKAIREGESVPVDPQQVLRMIKLINELEEKKVVSTGSSVRLDHPN